LDGFGPPCPTLKSAYGRLLSEMLHKITCRADMEQPHATMELQKSLLEQMNNKLRETEEHIRQEIANRVGNIIEWPHHFTNTNRSRELWRIMHVKWNNGRRGKLNDMK